MLSIDGCDVQVASLPLTHACPRDSACGSPGGSCRLQRMRTYAASVDSRGNRERRFYSMA